MRTIEYGTTTHVPAFLTKLWKLVTDASCDELISWSLAGTSFIIFDEIRFSKELLPMYFKHNNMASFVRQLNMYGFRKLSCIDQGGMHSYKNEIEFYHQYFLKGQETLLELIKRKIPNSRSEEPKVRQEYIEELISNIKSLKGKQDSAEQGMRTLKRENRMLWRHVNILTERYSKQQSVLQQLLPFFMNMVRSSREIALKRKAQLMIDEGEERSKIARMSPPYYVQHMSEDSSQGMPTSPGNVSNRGPVIHEVTEMENTKMYPGSILCSSSNTTAAKECEAIVDSPLSCNLENSEQTIDSPFTEPGTLERLNILNQNFESRSRSSSMSSGHSPTSVSHRLPSSSAMPITSHPTSSYTTVIIDETTSDVPSMSDNLINHFAPKLEETVRDRNVYNISSLMNNRVPIIDESSTLMNEPSSSMNKAPSMMNERLSMINEGPSMVRNEGTSSMIRNEGTSSMIRNGGTSSMIINEGAPSMIRNEGTSSMIRNEGAPSIIRNGRTSSMIRNDSSVGANGSLPIINEVHTMNTEEKYTPNYIQPVKTVGQEMNWMLNQGNPTPYATEPNFDHWLGQIFKSDNLTAGCSLPQQSENVFV